MPRVPTQVSRDNEAKAWLLRQRFWTEQKIADELGLDQSTVSKMLSRVEKQLAAELKEQAEVIKARQTAQLETVAAEAFDAWERSKEAAVTRKQVGKEKSVEGKAKIGPAPQFSDPTEDFDPEGVPNLYLDEDGEETPAEVRAQRIADAAAAHFAEKSKPQQGAGVVFSETTTTEEKRFQVGDPRFLDQAQKALSGIRGIWGIDAPVKSAQTNVAGEDVAVTGYIITPPAPHGTISEDSERKD